MAGCPASPHVASPYLRHPSTPAPAVRAHRRRARLDAGGRPQAAVLPRRRHESPSRCRRSPSRASRTGCGSTPASRPSSACRAREPTASSTSRPRPSGPCTASRLPRRHGAARYTTPTARRRQSRPTTGSRSRPSSRSRRCSPSRATARCSLGLAAVIEQHDGQTVVLGARAPRGKARLPSQRFAGIGRRWRSSGQQHVREVRHRSAAATSRNCAGRSSGRRVALLAHPASVTADLTHSLDAIAALDDLRSRRPSARSTACAATSRTTWSSRRTSATRRTASRSSASTARCAARPRRCWTPSTCCWWTCRTSAAASTRSSPRCATCSRRRRSTARPSGCWTARTRSGGRSRACACAPGWESFVGAGEMPMRHGLTLGEMGRWFVRALGARRRLSRRRDARLATGARPGSRLADSASAPGSTRARTRRTCRWRAATRARSCSRARRCRKAAARRVRSNSSARPISTSRGIVARDAAPRAGWLRRLPAAALLVRADVPQARGPALRGAAVPRRRPWLRPRGIPAVAAPGAGLQGACAAPARLRPLARFPLRVRARPARDRPDQRQRAAAPLGGRRRPRRPPTSMRLRAPTSAPGSRTGKTR